SLRAEIVGAVIDAGLAVNQEDLSYYENTAEIPGNGLDDDNNGYVDDVQGWNAYNSSGTLPGSTHGTHVAGIIGAVGNNGIGISGVNWQVSILPIAGSSGNEATVLEAYAYALHLRKLYNQSQGNEGAFVVASNSSFGVNFGQPANFPLWCAMYDSLGQAGILNAVATMNTPADVDLNGDMPSTCGSEYVIAVTNTTDQDQKNPGSAFGQVNIDLGAPGTQILSTFPNDGYGSLTGTSMATPHVAGAISLLVAASCPGWMIRYRNDPAEVALLYKALILNETDALGPLQGLVATSGRLNVNNSLLALEDSCMALSNSCLPPYQISGSGLTDSSIWLNWAFVGNPSGFQIRLREAGAANWQDSISLIQPPFVVDGLSACTDYEFQVQANCGGDLSEYLCIQAISSEGCCEPPTTASLDLLTDSTVDLFWHEVFGATLYSLRYRAIGAPTWIDLTSQDTSLLLSNLAACTTYEYQLATTCDTVEIGFSASRLFTSSGCGSCLDLTYCPAGGNTVEFEWINQIQLGPIDNFSGANSGYGDFTDVSYQLSLDSTYQLFLTPGFDGPPFAESWRIWVDLNQDGMFQDSTELIYDPGPQSGQVQALLSFPPGTPGGSTRMRIAMKFPGFGSPSPPEACGLFEAGEVEDYCITLTSGDSVFCERPQQLEVERLIPTQGLKLTWAPVPGASQYLIRWTSPNSTVFETDTVASSEFVLQNLPACNSYQFAVQAICTAFGSGYSSTISARSPGCGACLDMPYCTDIVSLGDNEWIQGLQIGGFNFQSGPDGGYGQYPNFTIEGTRGDSLELVLWPGFATLKRDLHWKVWGDWNQDGIFTENEAIFVTNQANQDTVRATGMLPADALGGNTRLRIGMGREEVPEVCLGAAFGEVEDYCFRVNYPTSLPEFETFSVVILPNPTQDRVEIRSPTGVDHLVVTNLLGQVMLERTFTDSEPYQVSLADLPSGIYLFRLRQNQQFTSEKIWKQ
ncbi:MAG: GEVED domain-containing protein, partial [Bacteroidota bacterium]